jgi:hypothetical protein
VLLLLLLSDVAEIVRVQLNLELLKVVVEILGSQDIGDLDQLVYVVFA